MSVTSVGGAPAPGGKPKVVTHVHNGVRYKIYMSVANGRVLFTVPYRVPGIGEVRKSSSDFGEMLAVIATIPALQAAAATSRKSLYGQDVVVYDKALALLKPTGLALDRAVEDYILQVQRLGTKTIHEVVTYYLETFPQDLKAITVAELIHEYFVGKEYDAESLRFYQIYLRQLCWFLQGKYGASVILTRATTVDYQEWVDSPLRRLRRAASAKTRKHRRAAAVTLLNFAREKRYLRMGHPTAAEELPEVGGGSKKRKRMKAAVPVFLPDQLRAVIQYLWPQVFDARARGELLCLVLGAFAGVRPFEVTRMTWEMILFDSNEIYLPAEITKTGFFRKFDMQKNLRAFLKVLRMDADGPIDPEGITCHRHTVFARVMGARWPYDGLRHSFASYLLAKTRAEDAVAMAMGTSRITLLNHYAGRVSKGDALLYWSIMPSKLPVR